MILAIMAGSCTLALALGWTVSRADRDRPYKNGSN